MSVADILTPNSLVSGNYTSVWTTTAGFTLAPTVVNIKWIRLGNIVQCTFVAYLCDVGAAPNTATITLPVPRLTPFVGLAEECNGSMLIYNGSGPTGPSYLSPVVGSSTTATINALSGVAAGCTLDGFFAYTLA